MQFKLVGWLKIVFFVLWGKIRPKAEIRLFQAVYLCCTGEHFTVEDLPGLNHSQQTDHFFVAPKVATLYLHSYYLCFQVAVLSPRSSCFSLETVEHSC